MESRAVENRVLAGLAIALAFLALVGWRAYDSAQSYIETSRLVAQSHQVIGSLEEICSYLSQTQARQSGYIITGDERYLAKRPVAVSRINALLRQLNQLTAGKPDQQQLPKLEKKIAEHLGQLDSVLRLRQQQGFEATRQKLLAGDGVRGMDEIHDMLLGMQKQEERQLQRWAGEEQRNAASIRSTFLLALGVVGLLFAMLFRGTRREMRERHKMEQDLRLSEERLRAIFDTAVEGIIVIGERGLVDRFNPAAERIFGYTADEVVGRNVSMLMPSPHREKHDGYLANYLRTGQKKIIGIGLEVQGQRRDGTTFPMDLSVAEIRLGERRMFTGIVRDVTERKRAQEQQAQLMHELEGANEELRNFAYVVSHDLKAPLRAIGSLTDWIAEDYADKFDEEGREHLRLLGGRVRRMDGLIDGILRYSRVGRVKEASVAVDLNQLLHEVTDLLSPPPNIVITADSMPTVVAEGTRLQQVFQNLLSNAIKYLDKPEGRIHVGCVAAGKEWKFSVSDNGPGIEERHFERIFHLFQTLAPRDKVESTGVGLALVKKIVEMYGGRIWVESKVGEGSTFYFTLPRNSAMNSTRGKAQ